MPPLFYYLGACHLPLFHRLVAKEAGLVLWLSKPVFLCSPMSVFVFSHSVLCDSLQPHKLWPTRLLCQWDSPGKSTGVGCHCLLQESTWRFLNHSLTTPSLDSTLTSLFAECLTGNCQKNVSTLSCLRRPPSPVVYGKSCIWKQLWNTLVLNLFQLDTD